MDKQQMLKERERLQAALDSYSSAGGEKGHHPSLVERIANLDSKIAQSADA